MDSLINIQVTNLVASRAQVFKAASLGDIKDELRFTPDSLAWANELDIFRQLDMINKPTNKGLYEITDGKKDAHSNLLVRSYMAKRDLPVKSIEVYYYKEFKNLKKIEAVYSESNALYFAKRSLIMNFDERKAVTILTHYAIAGVQKMIMSDSVHFTIKGNIVE